MYCSWDILLDNVQEITFHFLAFDLPINDEADMNYVKIETSGYGCIFSSKGKRALPFSLVSIGQNFQITARTGFNKMQDSGFLIKYGYGYPKGFIASN